ncbi:alpha-L-arabinofuranosidase C-terminal domain-containing protein [Flavobacterium sp. SLB02]|uniref:alpha-L-arabinofuranosidase C-terminal domain-containing protein n=1 Tax=Flavobacterium sp. SLB02 TaxID=2665645 RepID=UPI0012A7E898|nr:alpha-L-arabinofuranosidase C-terminal domain-containing protein [Flavobacterium sp. SLB02]QGK73233.1 carbohydrate-binding protein [Flavobacterium sp. SLB02]
MKNNILTRITTCSLIISSFYLNAQKTILELDASRTITKIQPTMFGLFFEDINFAADGGLYAELIKNRSFEFDKPLMGWQEPNTKRSSLNKESGSAAPVKVQADNTVFCRVEINNAQGYSLINEGFRGMGVKKDAKYNLSLKAANHNSAIKKIIFQLIDKDQKVIGETSIVPKSDQWTHYTAVITATQTQGKAKLKITFQGTGTIDLDMISLFPQDTWKNRKNGLRKDLVQLLYDMKPGFLRFPGGCIVEGRTLSDRYQWKKSVGNLEQRKTMMNRWNVEFNHKQTPDYFQSFGLGFFEYFQLSEDIGAEPLPILSCGMACQYNTGELASINELDPYVQDALDLIEFANGALTTTWGKIRSEAGHPEPFNLKYIGVGNEQWGPDYIERYKVFEKAIKAKYPNIIIVSGSGPSPDGEHFDFAMQELKKLNAELVDEHYYKSPQWFRENAGRYDNYDRKGPKIFAGEYAAQSVSGANPNNRNNWECAFSEAAFITGLERNAEVVHLTSYAPLMAHEDAWQWTPDMIWFNNLESYGSANYYVQQLFSTNKGTDLLSITKEGKPLTGQNSLYASAVKDVKKKEVIIKLVNTAPAAQEINIDLKGAKLGSKGSIVRLSSPGREDENTFSDPKKITPKQSEYTITKGNQQLNLPAYSLTVLKLKIIR